MYKGTAAFVLPSDDRNVVYVELFEGDDFGQIDIIVAALDKQISEEKIILN